MYTFSITYDSIVTSIVEPKGFAEIKRVIKRDVRTHGLMFEYSDKTVSLGFCDGRSKILEAYDTEGINAEILFSAYSDGSLLFSGIIDLETAKFGEDYIECDIEISSVAIKLSNNSNKRVNIGATENIDGIAITPAADNAIYLFSKRIQKSYESTDDDVINAPMGYLMDVGGSSEENDYVWGFETVVQNKIDGVETYINGFMNDPPMSSSAYIFRATEGGYYTFGLSGSLELMLYDYNVNHWTGDTGTILFKHYRGAVEIDSYTVETHSHTGANLTGTISLFDYSGSKTFDLQVGDDVYLYMTIEVTGVVGASGTDDIAIVVTLLEQNIFTINALTEGIPAWAKCYTIEETLDGLSTILVGANVFCPIFSSGVFKDNVITSGKAIRGMGSEMMTSWKSFMESIGAIFGVGYSIVNDANILVDRMNYFYSGNQILLIDNYSEYSIEPYGYYGSIKLGFERYAEEDDNATDAFSTMAEYSTGIKSKDELVIKSDIIADAYSIEYQRRRVLSESGDTAETFDEDLFVISGVEQSTVTLLAEMGVDVYSVNKIIVPGDITYYAGNPNVSLTGTNAGNYNIFAMGYSTENDETTISVFQSLVTITETVTLSFPIPRLVNERDENFAVAEGMIDSSTQINLRHNPRFMLNRNSEYINSFLKYRGDTDKLILTEYVRNGDITLKQNALPVVDINDPDRLSYILNGNVVLSSINNREALFSPEIIKFKTGLCSDDIDLIVDAHKYNLNGVLSTKNYGYISVINPDGEQVDGYLKELKIQDTTGICEFELIKKA